MNIEELRAFCMKLKGVTEDIKWGNDLVFSIGGKMFAVAGLESPFTCSFKVADEDFEELSNKPGFIPAPYMARNKWVLVTDAGKLNKKEWERRLKESYEMVAAKLTKKARTQLGL
jgi:predicted DNA-binding protein (MmcQ/YjbR family)